MMQNNLGVKFPQVQTDYSIIVCTYNPQHLTFKRVLYSLSELRIPEGVTIECVIVDNNSNNSVENEDYVQEFLEQCPWAKVIEESNQGLTFARIAGVRATTAPIVVFVDDDNELDPHYLEAIHKCYSNYPCVAAWGPGNIRVEFIEPVSEWFDRNFRSLFQERNCAYFEYGCVRATWTSFYPVGTGLVILRSVLDKYCETIMVGRVTSTDRKGNSLSSGGDIQIVWEAVKQGWAAGVSPDLKVNHLIPAKRTSLSYIQRLCFGTGSSYSPALVEAWPEEECRLPQVPRLLRVYRHLLRIALQSFLRGDGYLIKVQWAKYLGEISGLAKALNSPQAVHLENLARKLNFC